MSAPVPDLQPDPELLDLMLRDHARADSASQATAYWREIAEPLAEHLRDPDNLRHFRRSPLRTGVRSLYPANPGRLPELSSRGRRLERLLRLVPVIGAAVTHQQSIREDLIGRHVATFHQLVTVSVEALKTTPPVEPVLDDRRIGDPDDGLELDGAYYSLMSLHYQELCRRAHAAFAPASISSLLELGSGYGGQAEVWLRVRLGLRVALMDIPPWLYVAETYLKAAFPGRVLGYRETRAWRHPVSVLEALGDRRIAIIAPWQWDLVTDTFDLFWNARSLQEMGGNAERYLDRILPRCRRLFLHAYTPRREGVFRPDELRAMIRRRPEFEELRWEEDRFNVRSSHNLAAERRQT